MQLMDAAVAAAVPRFAFISVHDYGLPGARVDLASNHPYKIHGQLCEPSPTLTGVLCVITT